MRRSALWSAFVLLVATALYGGCTQNFDQFTSGTGTGGSSSASTGAQMGGGGGNTKCMTARDCPVATKECQVAACKADGMCGVDNAADGDACNAGHVCLSGACVDCIKASDCGTPANDCKQFTCTPANKCQEGNKTDGTSCGQDQSLSCTNGVCKGLQDGHDVRHGHPVRQLHL